MLDEQEKKRSWKGVETLGGGGVDNYTPRRRIFSFQERFSIRKQSQSDIVEAVEDGRWRKERRKICGCAASSLSLSLCTNGFVQVEVVRGSKEGSKRRGLKGTIRGQRSRGALDWINQLHLSTPDIFIGGMLIAHYDLTESPFLWKANSFSSPSFLRSLSRCVEIRERRREKKKKKNSRKL